MSLKSSLAGKRCLRCPCQEEGEEGGGSSSSWTWPRLGEEGWGSREEESPSTLLPPRARPVPAASGCYSSSTAWGCCDHCREMERLNGPTWTNQRTNRRTNNTNLLINALFLSLSCSYLVLPPVVVPTAGTEPLLIRVGVALGELLPCTTNTHYITAAQDIINIAIQLTFTMLRFTLMNSSIKSLSSDFTQLKQLYDFCNLMMSL